MDPPQGVRNPWDGRGNVERSGGLCPQEGLRWQASRAEPRMLVVHSWMQRHGVGNLQKSRIPSEGTSREGGPPCESGDRRGQRTGPGARGLGCEPQDGNGLTRSSGVEPGMVPVGSHDKKREHSGLCPKCLIAMCERRSWWFPEVEGGPCRAKCPWHRPQSCSSYYTGLANPSVGPPLHSHLFPS